MKIWGILCCLFLFSITAHAVEDEREHFVDIGNNERLFVHYKPAKNGARTVVFLHGLTYTLKPWTAFANKLEDLNGDLGILRYDMKGMGRTLLDGHLPVNYEIPYQDQVRQLHALLQTLKIEKPDILGLSYGGAIALSFAVTYPGEYRNIIMMAPFTEPLAAQDKFIRAQITATRLAFPFNPSTDDELYDFFQRQLIYTTFPAAEPDTLANPYILESVFRMSKGLRYFYADKMVDSLPAGVVHLMVANQDQYLNDGVLDRFWNRLPIPARASRLNIEGSEHKIPEAVPAFAAAWVYEIIKGNPALANGRVFDGNARTFEIRARGDSFVLPKPEKR
jgi:pimeloyl-ACP methyl ester carboxylesterase